METTQIADIFKAKFATKVRLKNTTVRAIVADKFYDRDRNVWMVEIMASVDGRNYSKTFTVNEIIDANDNNCPLRVD